MSPKQPLKFERLTWKDIERYLDQRKDILIPFGSTEEHGYHMPCSVDSIITEKVAEKVSERTGILIAPIVHYTACRSTAAYPGTISISHEVEKNLAISLMENLSEHGFKIFYLMTGHGALTHRAALDDAVRAITEKGLKAATIHFYRIDISDIVSAVDVHAGEVETSLMLYLKPELVDISKAEGGEYEAAFYTPLGKPTRSGVMGNPERASREKGEKIFERWVQKVSEFIESFSG